MNAPDFKIPRRARKQPEPDITVGPGASYTEYQPLRDPRMRLAMERARRDQPSMITLDSVVPIDYSARLDRTPLEKKP